MFQGWIFTNLRKAEVVQMHCDLDVIDELWFLRVGKLKWKNLLSEPNYYVGRFRQYGNSLFSEIPYLNIVTINGENFSSKVSNEVIISCRTTYEAPTLLGGKIV